MSKYWHRNTQIVDEKNWGATSPLGVCHLCAEPTGGRLHGQERAWRMGGKPKNNRRETARAVGKDINQMILKVETTRWQQGHLHLKWTHDARKMVSHLKKRRRERLDVFWRDVDTVSGAINQRRREINLSSITKSRWRRRRRRMEKDVAHFGDRSCDAEHKEEEGEEERREESVILKANDNW